jgi:hypothetical protein
MFIFCESLEYLQTVRVKSSVCLLKHFTTNIYREVEIKVHLFLISKQNEGQQSTSSSGCLKKKRNLYSTELGLYVITCEVINLYMLIFLKNSSSDSYSKNNFGLSFQQIVCRRLTFKHISAKSRTVHQTFAADEAEIYPLWHSNSYIKLLCCGSEPFPIYGQMKWQ